MKVDRALFNRPDLPEQIRQNINEVLFYRYAWYAWRLCRAGYNEEIEANLRQSLARSDLSQDKTLSQWTRHFVHWSLRVGAGIEHYQAMLPHIRKVMKLTEKRWKELEQVATWWAAVWSRYLERQDMPDGQANSICQGVSRDEIIMLAQQCLLLTPHEKMNSAIELFLKDSQRKPKETAPRRTDVAGLYLSAFGSAMMGQRRRIAANSLLNALAHSTHPRAITVWAHFAKNSLLYAVDSWRNTPKARR
jgi:hypothetical protein